MPEVSIEQNLENFQTYFRVKGIRRLLETGVIRIRLSDTNEMLGPAGWKKGEDISHIVRQTQDGDDLLLELAPKLIKFIQTGQTIVLQIDELRLSEEILPGELYPHSESSAHHSGGYVFREASSTGSPARAPKPRPEPEPEKPPAAEDKTKLAGTGGGDDLPSRGPAIEGKTKLLPDGWDKPNPDDVPTGPHVGEPGTTYAGDIPPEPDEPEIDEGAKSQKNPGGKTGPSEGARGRGWVPLAAAIVVGVAVGFFSKFIYDEYYPRETVGGADRGRLETAAFAPLSDTLRQAPARSPAGVTPDTVSRPQDQGNRSRSFFNYGAKKAQENNKNEAAYWYKQSLRACEADALTFLGDAYINGEGVGTDVRTGFQLLRLAAAFGDEKAKSYLIELLERRKIPEAPAEMGRFYR